jgi:hypothetical protein
MSDKPNWTWGQMISGVVTVTGVAVLGIGTLASGTSVGTSVAEGAGAALEAIGMKGFENPAAIVGGALAAAGTLGMLLTGNHQTNSEQDKRIGIAESELDSIKQALFNAMQGTQPQTAMAPAAPQFPAGGKPRQV